MGSIRGDTTVYKCDGCKKLVSKEPRTNLRRYNAQQIWHHWIYYCVDCYMKARDKDFMTFKEWNDIANWLEYQRIKYILKSDGSLVCRTLTLIQEDGEQYSTPILLNDIDDIKVAVSGMVEYLANVGEKKRNAKMLHRKGRKVRWLKKAKFMVDCQSALISIEILLLYIAMERPKEYVPVFLVAVLAGIIVTLVIGTELQMKIRREEDAG